MYDSFIEQLAGLDLSGFSIKPAPFDQTDFPCDDAIDQTLTGVWSDLFAMFADTALEADAEDIAWGLVNLFHRAATRKSSQLDRASNEIRALLACADGSEVHSSNLEEQLGRAQAAEASMVAFEQMREMAATLYREEMGSSWRPMSGSRSRHSGTFTSAVIDARDFLRARAERRRNAHSPEGTPVVFAGGRSSFPCTDGAKMFANAVWATGFPTCFWSMAVTARVPTGSQRAGPNAIMCSSSFSRSTGGLAHVQGSSATSRCST